MSINTNTWALSPQAIVIRLGFLLILGVLVVGWIDSTYAPIKADKTKSVVVHQSIFPQDSLDVERWTVEGGR